MERTFIVFKPDAVMRGIIGEIISSFEQAGLKIIGIKMVRPDYEHYLSNIMKVSAALKTRKGDQDF